jgi:CubicO group peptidase (beta-lactamase class C family)
MMMRPTALLVSMLLLPATAGLAQDTARMEQVVQSFAANGGFAGTILVARGDEVLFSKVYGTPPARQAVASLTKQFTAAAILLLEERGTLRLDDPVRTHLPSAPSSWDGMTIFHLLTHTAGFAGLQTPPALRSAPIQGEPTAAGYIAKQMERPLLTRPGETFSYTNTGYFVLGHLIERLSGQSYERFITDAILTPLGLKNTGPDPAAAAAMSPTAIAVTPNGAAGFSSTTTDLMRWQRALYGGKVVSAASLRKMTTPFKGDYGLALYIRTVDGRMVMTHGGGAPAFANLTWYPDRQVSVVVLGSTPTAPAPEIGSFLGTLAHGGTVVLASERKAITLPAAVLARYAGVYDMGGQPITIAVDGTQLAIVGTGTNKTLLLAASDTSFFLEGTNLRVEFVSDGAGVVTELIFHQGTREDRARRTSGR